MTAANERFQNLKAKGVDEFKRFLIIFIYLWVVFGLFSLNQAIILRNLSYLTHGFALLNAAVFAKIMLIAEDLKLGDPECGTTGRQPRRSPFCRWLDRSVAETGIGEKSAACLGEHELWSLFFRRGNADFLRRQLGE